MTRKTTAKRREDGGYTLSFGAGSKKLVAVAELITARWRITDGFGTNAVKPAMKLKDLKAAWHALAEVSYGESPPAPTLGGPPSIRKGPPSLRSPEPEAPVYGGPTCPECERPVTGWFDDMPPCRCNLANEVDYTPDPFDLNMYDRAGGDRNLSMSGVLDMVYYWMMRNPEYVQTEGVMDSPWKEVQEVLWRTHRYAEYRPERFTALAELGGSILEAERALGHLANAAREAGEPVREPTRDSDAE